ncbi:MAG: hypothetical protein RLY14_882 [Planctomycetota bacterium]
MSRIPSKPELFPPIAESHPSRWITVPLGFFAGGLATAVVAFIFAIVFTMGPFSRLLGFDEFDALMIIGLPVVCLPGGVIGGSILGSMRKCKNAYSYSVLPSGILAGIYFLMGISQQELSKKVGAQLISVTSVSVFMVASAAVGLWAISKLFRWIANSK